MEDENRRNLNAKQVIVIFVAIIGVILLVLLIITIYNIVKPNPYGESTAIEGLSSLGLSRDDQDQITAGLNLTIKSNLATDVETPTAGAKVRDDSVSKWHDEDEGVDVTEFIVDIESVRQSYNIHVEKYKDNNSSGYPFVIQCLKDNDKVIYPEFACVDDFTVSDDETIEGHLPYYGETRLGDEYTVRLMQDTDEESYLEVDVDSCGDSERMDAALEAAKAWVDSIGLESEEYSYYVPDYLCDSGGM